MPIAGAPLLAAGRRHRGQLPAEVTGFIGRQAELSALSGLFDSARLVTVTGPGGVGKTRIGLRAVAQAAGKYPDGVCFADLAGLKDPLLVADAVAECLGARREEGLAAVIRHLRDRRLLLVLDTCEHLIDGCATFAEAVLREAPGVTLLATSRQPLDIPGEHTLPVPALPVPGPDDTGNDGDTAVGLFAQRATAAVPSFRVTPQNRPHVIRLCEHLDGLPLAIELAAIRLRALPLAELADRLEHRFQVLDGGRRGAVPRHQTLDAVMRWSYDLCTREEQALWARLSVFSGTFDVPAAEHVCGTSASAGIIEPLIGLVNKSVVLRDDAYDARYRLPGGPREFGTLLLASGGDQDACRERHLAHYLGEARRFRDGTADDDQPRRFRELSASHDNLRAALAYGTERAYGTEERDSREPGTPAPRAPAVELATALEDYWVMSGRLREGRHWLGQAADLFPGPSHERASALCSRATLGAFGGETADAIADAREGIRIAKDIGSRRLAARGYLRLHAALTFGARCEEAAAAGIEAERLLTESHDDTGLIRFAVQRARLSQLAGQPALAIRLCDTALRQLADGERRLRGHLHTITAFARLQVPGEQRRCAGSAAKGLCAGHEAGDSLGTAYALEALAWLAAADGRASRAAWLTGAADPLWERAGKRLSGTATMVEAHQRAVKTAIGGLGEERFAAIRALGAACPLEAVVAAAVSDADHLDAQPPIALRPPGGQVLAGGPATGGQGLSGPASYGQAHRPRQGELTGRERQIAALVASGMSNREIAERLVISKRTVDAHVEHIFGKLGISSRVQLTLWLHDQPAGPVAARADTLT